MLTDPAVENRLTRASTYSSGREEIDSIPFFVHLVRAFIKADETLDLRPIIDSIQREPTITARVIGYANSAAYHGRGDVMSVKDAISRMGMNDARRLILPLAMAESFDFSRCPAFNLQDYLMETIYAAFGASCLGPMMEVSVDAAGWYSIGLLHSIGHLYMIEQEPECMSGLLSKSSEPSDSNPKMIMMLPTEFEQIFGFTFLDIGSVLLARWGLPAPFHAGLPYIDNPLYRGDQWQVAAIISLARNISRWDLALSATPTTSSDDLDDALALVKVVCQR